MENQIVGEQEVSELSRHVKEYFALENAATSWWHTKGHPRYERQLDFVSGLDVHGKKVLDVATGRGRFAIRYAKNGAAHVTATDISDGMLRIASENAETAGVASCIHFLRVDAEERKFENAAFDVINCMELYVHLPNPRCATRLFYDYLTPDGVLIANIDLPLTKKWYFGWLNEPMRSMRRTVTSWPVARYGYFKLLPRFIRSGLHNLFGWPVTPKAPVALGWKPATMPRLQSTQETLTRLRAQPEVKLSRAEDAICRMELKDFKGILQDVGFQIEHVRREGKWYQLPYGYIVTARKPDTSAPTDPR